MICMRLLFVVAVLACLPGTVLACEGPEARLVSVEGVVEVRAVGATAWRTAAIGQALCVGDAVAVRQLSRATVVLANDVLLRLDQNSVLTLTAFDTGQTSELGLLQGALHVLTRFANRLRVVTPYMNAMVDGTEFTVAVLDDAARVTVTEGQVRAQNTAGQQLLSSGLSAQAVTGQGPTALPLRPQDAVQWALYFPQIVQPTPAELAALPPNALTATQLAQQGRYTEALAAWPDAASEDLRVARAGWLLGVGRVEAAEKLLAEVLNQASAPAALTPQAAAVQALIQVVRNQATDALETAHRSIATDAQAAAGQLALSYALQGLRDPNAALNAARHAVTLQPSHALAWARKAELELSVGLLQEGQASATRALALTPHTPRARALLGFAQLLRGQDAAAQLSFAQAQEAYPADPLPHVGVGLALLRSGERELGRREIEIAVMLDPGNAELRALLGRAYLSEGREGVAANELGVARELDPHSPTPWFTQALLKQRTNRPVEAAADYQRALALNNQRAVFRPNSLLEADRAARAAALASTWRDLGFDGAMLSAARTALVDDPQSEAAHRLLAEAYAANPRFETARVSELLQAQLRQSPRSEPIAPQELQPGLPVLNGPRVLALQESSPLFDESQKGARLGALVGNQGALGSTGLAWRSVGDGQLSVGHFHYETDGFRPGADVKLNSNNLLWQASVTPELNAQAELRSSRREGGDVTQQLAADSAERQLSLDSDAFRLGVRFSPNPDRELIASAIWSERDENTLVVTRVNPGIAREQRRLGQHTRLHELMYSNRHGPTKWSLGMSSYRERVDDRGEATLTGFPMQSPDPLTFTTTSPGRLRHDVAFFLGAWDIVPGVALHGGLSHDDFKHGSVAVGRTIPKIGVTWHPTSALRLRVVNVRGVKGGAAKEQTIEPTQFAGFNQTFDDPEGARFRLYGFGLDHQLSAATLWGLEVGRRRLVIPVVTATNRPGCPAPVCALRGTEILHRLHFGHTLGPRWAIASALQYASDTVNTLGSRILPAKARTRQLPMRVAYFDPNGWSAYGETQGVWQSVRFESGSTLKTRSRFWLANVGLRYRLPGQPVVLVLEAANVFDREFEFQNTYPAPNGDPRPRAPEFQPGRAVTARVEIRF